MTEREQQRRLQSVEQDAGRIRKPTERRTWQDLRRDEKGIWDTINSLFCPIGGRPFPDRSQEEWEQLVREEEAIARATDGMTEVERNRYIFHAVAVGESGKSDSKRGETRHGESETDQAGQGESRE